jgi:ribosomal protein L22
MAKYPIKDEVDFLIAQAQAETDIAKEIVESIRGKGIDDDKKYYEEKLSLKMLEFFKEEEKVISLYAEAKKRPYLKGMLSEAKMLYEKNISNK